MGAGRSWQAGDVPWVQESLQGSAFASSGYAQCYFCGEMSAKLSVADLSGDHGRVEVYCDNGNCDAREMTAIVMRDGSHSDRRADVRMLRAVDEGTHTAERGPVVARSLQDIADADDPQAALARRLDTGPADYASPGR